MQLTESSIFIGMKRLRNLLYRAQFLMQKADRIIYGTPLMQASGKAIACFTLAFEVRHKRMEYLEEAMGWFTVLRTDLDFCIDQNIIKYRSAKDVKDGVEIKTPDSQKIELYKLVAQIDSDISKWRTSLAKGKTVAE